MKTEIKLLVLLVLLIFQTQLLFSQMPNGEGIFLMYRKSRCVECAFTGCVTLTQDVLKHVYRDGSFKVENGPVYVNTYSYPCACGKGPVIEEYKDEKGNSPYPWNRNNFVN